MAFIRGTPLSRATLFFSVFIEFRILNNRFYVSVVSQRESTNALQKINTFFEVVHVLH